MGEPPIAQNCNERDSAAERVAAMVHRVREQHRAPLLVRNTFRDTIQPLLRNHAHPREPRRVWVEQAVPVSSMAMRVRVRMLGGDRGYSLRDVEYSDEDVVQGPRAHSRGRGGEDFHEECPGVKPNAERAPGEENRDDGRAEDFKLAIPVGIFLGGRLAREPPAEERDEVTDEVLIIATHVRFELGRCVEERGRTAQTVASVREERG